jgi:hypothetical protein
VAFSCRLVVLLFHEDLAGVEVAGLLLIIQQTHFFFSKHRLFLFLHDAAVFIR